MCHGTLTYRNTSKRRKEPAKQQKRALKRRHPQTFSDVCEGPSSLPDDYQRFLDGTEGQFPNKMTEIDGYKVTGKILNDISSAVHASLGITNTEKIVFLDTHAAPLSHHPLNVKHSPDLTGIKQGTVTAANYKQSQRNNLFGVPWHHGETVVEWKPGGGGSQCVTYAGCLNQARPDKPGVYALSASPRSYQILWSDPSGHPCSGLFLWENLKPLVAYIHSLYRPPPDHLGYDPTIVRSPLEFGESVLGPPKWDITFHDTTYYQCEVIFVGEPWTRMTWVARSKDPMIIKDLYMSYDKSLHEATLIQRLHSSGYVPGWVQLSDSGPVMFDSTTVVQTVSAVLKRQKMLLIMPTYGKSLYACESIVHFLKVMYDVLEAHRWGLTKKRVLHRDISFKNILVYPQGVKTSIDDNWPVFIDEVLDPGAIHAPSYALLCDLGNGCQCPPSLENISCHALNRPL